jgi:uncharacterized YkwD family protein
MKSRRKLFLKKMRHLWIVPVILALLASVFSVPALAQEQVLLSRTYRQGSDVFVIKPMGQDPQIYEFCMNNQVVLRYRSMHQGLSAQERAQIILDRAEKLGQAMRDGKALVDKINQSYVVTIDGQLLVTVTEGDFKANNSTGEGLARVWLQNLLVARAKEPSGAEASPGSISVGSKKAGSDTLVKSPRKQESNRKKQEEQAGPAEQPVQTGETDQPGQTGPAGHDGQAGQGGQTGPNNQPEGQKPEEGTMALSAEEARMLQLVNEERAKAGVAPLTIDPALVKAARLKSQDMIDKNYFDHISPTYGDSFKMMKTMGIQFGYAGENLAGNPSVENAHETLMASPGHRKNILNPNYTHIGIGIVEGGPYGKMYTQLFISKP